MLRILIKEMNRIIKAKTNRNDKMLKMNMSNNFIRNLWIGFRILNY